MSPVSPAPTATEAAIKQPAADGLSGARLKCAALSIAIGMVVANLDMAIVQNALPALSLELHVTSSTSVWTITSYMLVTLTLLLPFAPLSDKVGYKRLYLGGFLVFVVASALCGLATAFWMLLAGRVLQGIGSAAMMCSTTSLLRVVYPKRLMARAIGSNSTLVAVSIAAAPSVSAFILLHFSWNWLFLLNIPLGILAVTLGIYALPANARQLPAFWQVGASQAWLRTVLNTDWLAVVANIVFFTLLLFGTQAISDRPFEACAMLAVAAVAGTYFVRRQLVEQDPMLPFDLLKKRNYALTIATSFGSFAAQGAAFVALPFFLQRTVGFDAKHTAVILTGWPLALAVSAQLASRLTARMPIEWLCAFGQGLMAIGLGVIATGVVPHTFGWLVGALAMAGAGFGFFQAPNNYVIVSSAPPDRSGSVGALRAATRTCGQLLGSAACGVSFLLVRHHSQLDGATIGVAVAATMALFAGICSLSRRN